MEINNKTISSIRIHCNKINYLVKLTFYIVLILAIISMIYTIFIFIGFGNSLEVRSFKDDFVIKASNFSFWVDGSISKSLVAYSLEQPFSNIKFAFIIAQIIFFNQAIISCFDFLLYT